jgi:hypothetical protein
VSMECRWIAVHCRLIECAICAASCLKRYDVTCCNHMVYIRRK